MMRSSKRRHNRIAKRVTAICAGAAVLAGAVVCTAHFMQQNALAKDTLNAIDNVCSQISVNKPYTILEIVPDTVTASGFVVQTAEDYKSDPDGSIATYVVDDFVQTMGMMGYYVSGQEPVTKDIDAMISDITKTDAVTGEKTVINTPINDAVARKQFADKLLQAVVDSELSIVSDTKNAAPLYATEEMMDAHSYYTEIREGEEGFDAAQMSKDVAAGKYHLLIKDYTGLQYRPDDDPPVPYEDITYGYMMEALDEDDAPTHDGNFVKNTDGSYEYKKGTGDYRFISYMNPLFEDVDDTKYAADVYRIRLSKIYYSIGITNNDWFKKYSLDRDDAACGNIAVTVNSIPARKVTKSDVDKARMISVMSGIDKLTLDTGYRQYERYIDAATEEEVVNDISVSVYTEIVKRLSGEHIPVMLDYDIVTQGEAVGNHIAGTLVYTLIKNLKVDDLDLYYRVISTITDVDELKDIDPSGIGTIRNNNDDHFVDKSLYIYNMKTPDQSSGDYTYMLNTKYDSHVFADSETEDGFAEVVENIANENVYRKAAGKTELSDDITEARVIRYIIAYANNRNYDNEGTMRILEIQPCASFDLSQDSTGDGTLYVRNPSDDSRTKIVGQSKTRIELTQITTAEFIGHIEDLNAHYDMIYIGLNTGAGMTNPVGRMNTITETDGTVRTDYNDSNMNSLIYSHMGDSVQSSNGMGLSGEYRYSGNDLTEEKKNALIEYIKAGFPICLADDFIITEEKTDGSTKEKVNEKVIDNSSNMYEFVANVLVSDYASDMFVVSNLTSDLFNLYLNDTNPLLTLADDTQTATENVIRLTKKEDGKYHAIIDFIIYENGTQGSYDYDCRLYADTNIDGKFADASGAGEKIVITPSNFAIHNMSSEGASYRDGRFRLTPNTWYRADYILPDDYEGLFPWRLQIVQNRDDEYDDRRRADADGYFEVFSEEKTPISILQLTADQGSTWNMEDSYADTGSKFYRYMSDERVNYDASITTLTLSEFYTNGGDVQSMLAYMNGFDVVVIGCANAYTGLTGEAKSAIYEYMRAGRSIVFTNDTLVPVTADIRDFPGVNRFSHDKTYTPRSNRNETLEDGAGYTYGYLNYGIHSSKYANLADIKTGSAEYDRMFADNVNKGQLMMYPYTISERIDISTVHPGIYQLDFMRDDDADGKTDVTVWYTIGGSQNTVENDAYKRSPKDASNNYYMFNKSNISYMNIGSRDVNLCTDMEMKLFINTLIDTYRAGVHPPKVSIVESYHEDARKIQNLYVSYDTIYATYTQNILDISEDMYFRIKEVPLTGVNAKSRISYSAKLYVEVPAGTPGCVVRGYQGKNIYAFPLEITELYYLADDGVTEIPVTDLNNLLPEKNYKTKIPIQILASANMLWDETGTNAMTLNTRRFFVEAIEKVENDYTHASFNLTALDDANLVRVQMFDLD